MEKFFLILFLFSGVMFVSGLIRPSIVFKIFKRKLTHKQIFVYFGFLTISFFILIGVFAPPPTGSVTIDQDWQQEDHIEEPQNFEQKNETEEKKEEVYAEDVDSSEALNQIHDVVVVEVSVPEKDEAITEEELFAQPSTQTFAQEQIDSGDDTQVIPLITQSSQNNCSLDQVDINLSSAEELIKIIHIDSVRAEDLIRLRPHKSIDGLTRIKGIGPARLADIKSQGIACVQ